MAKDDIATIGHVKRIIRLRLRRQSPPEEQHLNIYPMMDIMMIILVFLIMQFATSAASVIQESPELKIPFSSAEVSTADALPIQISRNEIAVEGKRILALREGNVDPNYKQGGTNGFLVVPLFKLMKKSAERQKLIAEKNPQRPFEGKVLIVADKRTPYRTLTEVLYTLGQAEFKQLKFVVNKGSK